MFEFGMEMVLENFLTLGVSIITKNLTSGQFMDFNGDILEQNTEQCTITIKEKALFKIDGPCSHVNLGSSRVDFYTL